MKKFKEFKKIQFQKEWFETLTTDHLLSMRFSTYCQYPSDDKSEFHNFEGQTLYYINKETLYNELSKRPNRVRAKDLRKNNQKSL